MPFFVTNFKLLRTQTNNVYRMKKLLVALFLLILTLSVDAQPARQVVQVIVTPDHADWTYEKGQQPRFTIAVLRNYVPLENVTVQYRIGPEKMAPWKEGSVTLNDGKAVVKAGRSMEAGFLNCQASVVVDGKTYSSYATAGFSPETIQPTTTLPADFLQFWTGAKEELSKIPIKPVMTLMPELSTDKVDVYHVSINNVKGKIYGVLCKPKAEGKYPAILNVPGAGVRPYKGYMPNTDKGVITFQIGIHGIPLNLDQVVYNDLKDGALEGYQKVNFDDKEQNYYKRVYLGCVRAIDFIESLECYDGTLAVTGNSQGGALSIVTAALDNRVDYLAAVYPALCDLTGYLHGRAGGWPHLFLDEFTNKADKVENSKYYDVVNFARFVKVPGWYTWGYNDNVCPPTSMYAAYNVIEAPKELHVFQETQHWLFPEQDQWRNDWLYQQLKK